MSAENLSIGAVGEDVAALHEALRWSSIDVPESEVVRGFFGPESRAAVQECQRQLGLSITGVVDSATAAVLPSAGHISEECTSELEVGSAAERELDGPGAARRLDAAREAGPIAVGGPGPPGAGGTDLSTLRLPPPAVAETSGAEVGRRPDVLVEPAGMSHA